LRRWKKVLRLRPRPEQRQDSRVRSVRRSDGTMRMFLVPTTTRIVFF
jgi:hypothetical protein